MQNVRVPAQALNSLLKVAVAGGLGVYGVSNSIFNVEGGHRAIIFNRLVGIKDTVRVHDGAVRRHVFCRSCRTVLTRDDCRHAGVP